MFEWTAEWERVSEGSASPLALVGALEALDDAAMVGLDEDEALAVVELTQAAVTALGAVQALAVEAYTRRQEEEVARFKDDARRRGSCPWGILTGDELATATLATVFHLTPRTMGSQLDETRRLVNALPGVFKLVRAGRLDVHRARVVSSEAALVSFPRLGDVDEAMVRPTNQRYRLAMIDLSVAALRKRAAATAVAVDPDCALARAHEAIKDRYVRVSPGLEPGMSSWSASLPADVSVRLWAAVDGLAAEYLAARPDLLVGQARADALGDLVLANATITTSIDLVVPLAAMPEHLERPDEPSAPVKRRTRSTASGKSSGRSRARSRERSSGTRPRSELERHLHLVRLDGVRVELDPHLFLRAGASEPPPAPPPIDPHPISVLGVTHHLVGIILNPAITALLADPDTRIHLHGSDLHTGAIVVHDPTTYRPNQRLRRIVRARDGHCRFPGCGVEARRCQLDHVIRFPDGPTTLDNLHSLCTTHHAFKHHSGWTVTMDPTGDCTWTTPRGRTLITVPDHTLDTTSTRAA